MIAAPVFRRPAVENRCSIADQLSLHFLDWPGTGPPVLLLHGNKSNARVWDFVVDASALPNRRFLAPDLRGHGLSDAPPTGYRIETLIDDVWAFLAALSVDRVIVVGTATGGYMALTMASARPEAVAAIAIVDSGIWIDPAINFAPRKRVYADLAVGRAALDRSDGWGDAQKDHYALHSFRALDDGRVEYRHFEQTETAESRADFDIERLNVTCPALLVRGEHSDITSTDALSRLAGYLPQAQIATVAGSGHHIPLDRPAGLAAALDDFIGTSSWPLPR
ncbi:MAG: alpha/beta hydrolase [Proteobacteria bacterium]|nr:alpha/beta hydrolase [Pseudomonadota bacterium]